MSDPSADYVRLSINLAPDVAAALQAVAAGHGVSVTEAVRVAVSLLWCADDVALRGDRLVIHRGTGRLGRGVLGEINPEWGKG